jgi:hypothetical protein
LALKAGMSAGDASLGSRSRPGYDPAHLMVLPAKYLREPASR